METLRAKSRSHITLSFLAFIAIAAAALYAAAGLRVKVTAELANIRQKPSISSSIVRQFPQGAILEAVRQEGEWFLVKFDADESGVTSGYVHESLVMALDDIPGREPATKIEPPVIKREPAITSPATPPVSPPTKVEPVVAAAAAETAYAEERIAGLPGRVSLTLHGGGSLVAGGELNTAAQGLADYYASGLGVAGDTKVAAARMSLSYGVELGLPITDQLFVVAGAEFHKAEKSTVVSYALGTTTNTFTATPGFQGLPLKAGLAFYPSEFVYVKLGVSYYFAKASYDYRYAHDKYEQEWQGEATAQGFGLWGGFGLDWPLADAFSLIFEATGEYAPLTGFTGTGTYLESTSSAAVTETGKLYAFNSRTSSQTSFPVAFIRSKAPTEANVENVREAMVDFSGISIRAGIKIRF
jgi:hypothetical protein